MKKQRPYVATLEEEFKLKNKTNKKVASFFSGGGGLDLGFEAAGFDVTFSSDVVQEYTQTINQNISDTTSVIYDVSKVHEENPANIFGLTGLSGVIGGPPCQSFSILGSRRSTQDPRGALVFDYMHIIKSLEPDFFVFENVPGLKTLNKGKDWDNIMQTFVKITGYELYTKKLNSVGFGVPQIRERVFIVGFRQHGLKFSWPEYTHQLSQNIDLIELAPFRTVSEAFQKLDNTTNNEKRIHGERVSKRYANIFPGSRDKVDHTDRLVWDKPSGTVLVGSGGGGGRPFIHPEEHRHITVREAARLQSFPDWWNFSGGSTKQYRQVGNAVPPIMAKRIAERILETLHE